MVLYSAFETYSCITYYQFFKLSKLFGAQNNMFATPIFSLGGSCPPPPPPPGLTPLHTKPGLHGNYGGYVAVMGFMW